MRATKNQIWKVKVSLLKKGYGSKLQLAKDANIAPSELSSFLNGGSLKEEKVNRVLAAAGVKTEAV